MEKNDLNWWQVDLERVYVVSYVFVVPADGKWRFILTLRMMMLFHLLESTDKPWFDIDIY